MLDDGDLEAATSAGIVTQQQADALRKFAAERQAQNAIERADDERFRFMRSFNDVFFAVGIALFGLGLGFFASIIAFGHFLAAAITWALSELVVRRLRLVLPGILLACLFTYFAMRMVFFDWRQPSGTPFAISALVGSGAAAIFYARFRLPFALLLIAAGLIVFIEVEAFSAGIINTVVASLILLLCGLAVFGCAMIYDVSDPERITRRSDCAFWLHLLAAPLIVHSIFQLLVPGSTFGHLAGSLTTTGVLIVFAVIVALTIVALLVDRRALFVSALSYLGVVIGYTISFASGQSAESSLKATFATLLILGAMVLALGVAWQPLRRVFIRLFPTSLTNRLPRVAPA